MTRNPAAVDQRSGDATIWLRIVAIFVILISGLAGGLPPLFSKVRLKLFAGKFDDVGRHCQQGHVFG
jgi:hypothetical protein